MKYSLHIVGMGKTGEDVSRLSSIRKKEYGDTATLRTVVEYRRAKESQKEVSKTLLEKRIPENEGTPWRILKQYASIDELTTLFAEEAEKSIQKGQTPVLLLSAKYDITQFLLESDYKTVQDTISAVTTEVTITKRVIGGTEQPLLPDKERLFELNASYLGIRQLTKALRKNVSEVVLGKTDYLILTNPVDITTYLFAEMLAVRPEQVLAPSDNDRTRFITDLISLKIEPGTPTSDPLIWDRRDLNNIVRAVGPHNSYNRITRTSAAKAFEYINDTSGKEQTKLNDFEKAYNWLMEKSNTFGRDAYLDLGFSCTDTALGTVNLLDIMFPPSNRNRQGNPQQVKAIVYDPTRGMYIGNMIESNEENIRDEIDLTSRIIPSVIPSIEKSNNPTLLRYRVVDNVLDNDPQTQQEFDMGNYVIHTILYEMQKKGLIEGELGKPFEDREGRNTTYDMVIKELKEQINELQAEEVEGVNKYDQLANEKSGIEKELEKTLRKLNTEKNWTPRVWALGVLVGVVVTVYGYGFYTVKEVEKELIFKKALEEITVRDNALIAYCDERFKINDVPRCLDKLKEHERTYGRLYYNSKRCFKAGKRREIEMCVTDIIKDFIEQQEKK